MTDTATRVCDPELAELRIALRRERKKRRLKKLARDSRDREAK